MPRDMSAASDPSPAPPAESSSRSGAREALRVLVAEDDPLLRAYLVLQVERMGHLATEVGNGEAALAALATGSHDVLISDWVMPGLSGLELVRRIRHRDQGYLHIILMTSPGETRTIRDALAAGADDFLLKPLTEIDIELGLASAARVVRLKQSLERRNAALEKTRERLELALGEVRRDLDSAARLQRRLLPAPRGVGALRHATSFTPSLSIGGDSLGRVELADGRAFFFALDVSGHGVPAALNSFSLHRRICGLAEVTGGRLEVIAERLNRQLLDEDGEAYFTAAMVSLAPDGTGELLRAGHPYPLLIDECGVTSITDGCLPIGMVADAIYRAVPLSLAPGARLLIHSDGVTDGGLEPSRLAGAIAAQRDSELDSAIGAIDWLLLRARNGGAPADDISMLLIERESE